MTEERFARYPSLDGKVVLITGGGSGIGASMVEHFAHQGAKTAFLDVAEETSRELVNRLAKSAKHTPRFIACDLTDIPTLRAVIQKIEANLGPIEVLVNNAANDERHTSEETTPEYWDRMMAVNLRHH